METPIEEIVEVEETVETPVEEVIEETVEAPVEEVETPVDETPDPEILRAEIEGLEKKRQKAEEDAKYWRDQKKAERAEFFKNKQKEPEPAETEKPKVDDFEDYTEYVEALTDYKVEQKRAEWQADEQKRTQDATLHDKELELFEKLDRGIEKYEDFREVVSDQTAPITATIKDILMESDHPEDIAYYLCKNRTEGIRISRLSAIAATREIARIETKLTTPTKEPVNKITNAPVPIKPVGASNTVSKDPNKMTQKEYNEWRIANGAKPF